MVKLLRKPLVLVAVLTAVMAVAALWPRAQYRPPSGKARLSIGQASVVVEVVSDPRDLTRGLMGRRQLPEDAGMLFVLPTPGRYCMWMKDTPIPLSVAFIDASGRIVNIETMQPLSLENHCSSGPSLYALEVNTGWFDRHGVQAGAVVAGLHGAAPLE